MTQQSSSKGGQRDTTTTAGQAKQPATTGATRDVADQAKDTVGQIAGQAQHAAGEVAGQAREQLTSRLSGQKDRAAEGLTGVAQALRQTGQQLRDQDQQGLTTYIDRAASQIDRLSGYIQQKDLGELVDDVEQMARRQPAMFLGGAFVLGLLGARFLKSSRPYSSSTALARRSSNYPPYSQASTYGTNYAAGTQFGSTTPSGQTSTGYQSSYGTGPRSYEQGRED